MLGASLLPEACDKATSLTRAGSIFVRSISAFRMTAPSSPAPIDDRLPPNLPTGVRIGATMAARRRVISGLRLLSVMGRIVNTDLIRSDERRVGKEGVSTS